MGRPSEALRPPKSILGMPDPWLSLMIYRNTAVAATGCNPTQFMLHRHIRTNYLHCRPCSSPAHLILIQSVRPIRGQKRSMSITIIHATVCALCSHCTQVMQYVSNWTSIRAGIAQVLCMVRSIRHDPT